MHLPSLRIEARFGTRMVPGAAAPWTGDIRALLYPVQFERNLMNARDRVLHDVVGGGAMGRTPAQFRASIRQALGSGTSLSALLGLRHPEADVRSFLSAIGDRLPG